MTSIVEFQRSKDQFQREIFRRIGYTNTLYNLFRFGEVIKDTYTLFPLSQTSFIRRILDRFPNIKDMKYATGILDVLSSFSVIKKVGSRVVLTSRGRCLGAISNETWYDNIKFHFFLKLILEADGDYILNLLSLIPNNKLSSDSLKSFGVTFFQNITELLMYRNQEIQRTIPTKLINDFSNKYINTVSDSIKYDILNEPRSIKKLGLEDRIKNLKAMKSGKKIGTSGPTDTLRHTLEPRRGWLSDLQLISKEKSGEYSLTQRGKSLIDKTKSDNFDIDGLMRVPFSESLMNKLSITGPLTISSDYFNLLSIYVYFQEVVKEYSGSVDDFYGAVGYFYERVRLKQFKQAAIPAIYDCIAMLAASNGEFLSEGSFYDLLNILLSKYQNNIFKVAGRYRQEGYISFRK